MDSDPFAVADARHGRGYGGSVSPSPPRDPLWSTTAPSTLAVSTTAATARAAPKTSPAQPQVKGEPQPEPYVEFGVGTAVSGPEVIKRITFFPIGTTLKVTERSVIPCPNIPIGPHELHISRAMTMNRWGSNSPAKIDRRYSELVDFRSLLAYQFPTIVVPPLQPKTQVASLGTFLCNENHLIFQKRSILRFLREMSFMPELVFYSQYTPLFFQLPRETFEEWMQSMRVALQEYRNANASVDAYSTRRGGVLRKDSVAAIADSSTKVVRSVIGMFQSWMGGGSGGADKSGGTDAGTSSGRPEQQPQVGPLDYSRTELSSAADLTFWRGFIHHMEMYHHSLSQAVKPYREFVGDYVQMIEAEREVADALERLADSYSHCSGFSDLSTAARSSGSFMLHHVQAIQLHPQENNRDFLERMQFEIGYIDAALDAADHVICLILRCDELLGDPHFPAFAAYTRAVSVQLREDVQKRFLPKLRQRMRNMIHGGAKVGVQYSNNAVEALAKCEILRLVEDPDFMAFRSPSTI